MISKITPRGSDRFLLLLGVRLIVWVLAAAASMPALFADPAKMTPHHDEHFYYAHEDAARITIAEHHQLPAWNPYYCGGIPGIANPQDSSLAPESLLKLAYGTSVGRRLSYLLFLVLAMEGTYRYARRWDASVIGSALAAVVFSLSGFFTEMVRIGWLNFVTFGLMPWVLLGFEEGIKNYRWRLVSGFVLGWMVLSGGLYSVPYTVLTLGVLWAVETGARFGARSKEPWTAPTGSLVIVGVVSFGVAAVKVVPMLGVVVGSPRIWETPEARPLADILSRLTQPTGHEGPGAYIGFVMLALALFGAALDRRGARMFGLGLAFFLFALGNFASWAPNSILAKMPVFNQLRSPHRFVIVVSFFFCIAAARGLTQLEDLGPNLARRLRRVLTSPVADLDPLERALFGLASAFFAYQIAMSVYRDFLKENPLGNNVFGHDAALSRPAPFRQSRGNRWDAQVWPPAGRGSLQCFEETQFVQSGALRGDLAQDEYPEKPELATVKRLSWSPNAIDLQVSAKSEAIVIINQNWNKAFRANVGEVVNHLGLVAVKVPAGEHKLTVKYRDNTVIGGALLSFFTLVLLLGLVGRDARDGLRAARKRWDELPPI